MMNIEVFCDALRNSLVPRLYPTIGQASDPACRLLLRSGNLLMGRYVFAVFEWDESLDGEGNLNRVRLVLRNSVFTIPWLISIGAYVVFFGKKDDWRPAFRSMPADQTGLHAVIIQAIHCVDLATGKWDINQSEWGPIRFGGVDSVTPTVNHIVESAAEVDFREV
jgi:hypothetical protein